MKEYKQHYVAFIDILGFKNLLQENSCEDIYPIFSVLHSKSQSELNLNGIQIKAYECIKHTILSDSIILYIDADVEDAFAALLDVCGKLQTSLAQRKKPILLRGGVAKGNLFYENDIIYGEGLTKAYLLETKLAKYPRIIFTGDTLNIGLNNTKYMFTELEGIAKCYIKDSDGLYYIDYLSNFVWFDSKDMISYFDGLKNMCNHYLNMEIDYSLREKYIWLQSTVEKAIEKNGTARKHYTELAEKEREEIIRKYNAKFSIYKQPLEVEININ